MTHPAWPLVFQFSRDLQCLQLIQYQFAEVANVQDGVVSAFSYYSPGGST